MTTTGHHALGNDPDFQALHRSLCSIGAASLRAGSTTADQRAQLAALRSKDPARAATALAALGASTEVIEQQRRLLRLVMERHDLPLDERLGDRFRDAAASAKWSYDDEHGGGPAPDPWEELEDELDLEHSNDGGSDDDDDGCYDGCAALAAWMGASALGAYTAALAGCAAGGPFALLCWAGATAVYVAALYGMDAAVDNCVENCGG